MHLKLRWGFSMLDNYQLLEVYKMLSGMLELSGSGNWTKLKLVRLHSFFFFFYTL